THPQITPLSPPACDRSSIHRCRDAAYKNWWRWKTVGAATPVCCAMQYRLARGRRIVNGTHRRPLTLEQGVAKGPQPHVKIRAKTSRSPPGSEVARAFETPPFHNVVGSTRCGSGAASGPDVPTSIRRNGAPGFVS